jgi:hypothetical protein
MPHGWVPAWAVAVGVFWLNALPAAFGRGRTLGDRLAGTAVANVQFRQAVTDAAGRGRAMVQRARHTAGAPAPESTRTPY